MALANKFNIIKTYAKQLYLASNGGEIQTTGQMFMRVDEVAKELGVSKPYAYKLIRAMNEELKKTGCITITGRID